MLVETNLLRQVPSLKINHLKLFSPKQSRKLRRKVVAIHLHRQTPTKNVSVKSPRNKRRKRNMKRKKTRKKPRQQKRKLNPPRKLPNKL